MYKIYLTQKNNPTCVELETELGLNRGGISEKIIYPNGDIEIASSILLNTEQITALEKITDAKVVDKLRKKE